MSEPSTSSFFVVLLFILRCLVPLAILFGISYLLRRMGLVAIETYQEPEEKSTGDSGSATSSPKLTNAARSGSNRKKAVTPMKKGAGKTKTGNQRSRGK